VNPSELLELLACFAEHTKHFSIERHLVDAAWKRVGAAALDCFHDEPLARESPLWALPNVLITPHSAGETARYEANLVDILIDNIERLLRGETALRNQVV